MAREMKDSGIEWIGKIPAEWKYCRIKHYFTFEKGKNAALYTQEYIGEHEGTFPVYSGQTENNGVMGLINTYDYDISECIFTTTVGAKVMTPKILCGKFNLSQNCLIMKATKECCINFCYYALLTLFDYEKSLIPSYMQPSLRIEDLKKYVFYTPEFTKQRKISNFLDRKCSEIDTIIAKIKVTIEEYKSLKQSIITTAVTNGIRGDRPMKDSGIEWLPVIPTDWEVHRAKRLFHETNERSETGSEELLTVSHITGITPRSQKNVNMFKSESLVGYKICHVGDIAANTMWMWQGAIGVSNYEGVISPSYNTYRQSAGAYESRYLDYLLRIRPLIDVYSLYSTGITASRLRLYPEQFLSLKFIVSPLGEQKEIADYLDSKIREIDNLLLKKERYLAELEAYKKSLIFEYVTGKKEVPLE